MNDANGASGVSGASRANGINGASSAGPTRARHALFFRMLMAGMSTLEIGIYQKSLNWRECPP